MTKIRFFSYIALMIIIILAQLHSFGWVLLKWNVNFWYVSILVLIASAIVYTIKYLLILLINKNNLIENEVER